MRILSDAEFNTEAESTLNEIFINARNIRKGYSELSLAQPHFVHKIIFQVFWKIQPPLIDAIITAAKSVGDVGCYMSGLWILEGLNFTPEPKDYAMHWYIPFDEFQAAYVEEDIQFEEFNLKQGLFMSNVLLSPQGQWGIRTGEDFGVLSGSPEFMEAVQQLIPDLDQQVYTFLKFAKKEYRHVNTDWIRVLLERMYGREGSQALLTEAGF